ncbi:MAG: tyrosine-type recombinase/integrase [Verrucomicrobia bacterium]|nr:tyrosine-type recombinase/integrase [Verrucomicrobiota bacterium]
MKKPTVRTWTDPRTGKNYLRVRTTDTNGKSVSRMFTDPAAADEYVADLTKENKRHGRAAAVNSDEVAGLALWRDFVAGEHTAGRDAPALRDVLSGALGRLREGVATPALADLHKKFIDAREREAVSAVHLHALKMRLNRFVSYFPADEPAGAVTTERIEKAMASMRAGGLAPQTIKGIRGAAHGLFQWALDRNLVAQNPVARAKAPKVTQGEVGTITPSQLLGLLNTALQHRPGAVPALAVWAFCGVRRAELGRLRYADLDLKRQELRISAKVAKTGVTRFIPVPPALAAWLEAAEAAGVGPLGKIVPGEGDKLAEGQINRWLRELRPLAGLTEWPSNALRHSFASHACAMTDDYSRVAAWLGHARDPRLLIGRYRHAVPKDAGAKWFNVFPEGYAPPKATRKPNRKIA